MAIRGKLLFADTTMPVADLAAGVEPTAGTILTTAGKVIGAFYGGMWVDGKFSLEEDQLRFLGNASNPLFFGERKSATIDLRSIRWVAVKKGLMVMYLTMQGVDRLYQATAYGPGARSFCNQVQGTVRQLQGL